MSTKISITNDSLTNWVIGYSTFGSNNTLDLENVGLYLSNFVQNQYYIVQMKLTPLETASPDMKMTVITVLQSLKNPSIMKVMTNAIEVATGYIQGTVRDKKDGTPLNGALVNVKDNYGSESKVFSDADGKYMVKVYPLINSMFQVSANLKDYIGKTTNFIFKSATNEVYFELVGMNLDTTTTYIRSFPNPTTVGSGATFVYNVEKSDSAVKIELYDMNGKLIRKLVNATLQQGANYVVWDGSDETGKVVARGVYLLFIKEGDKNPVIKKVFVK